MLVNTLGNRKERESSRGVNILEMMYGPVKPYIQYNMY